MNDFSLYAYLQFLTRYSPQIPLHLKKQTQSYGIFFIIRRLLSLSEISLFCNIETRNTSLHKKNTEGI